MTEQWQWYSSVFVLVELLVTQNKIQKWLLFSLFCLQKMSNNFLWPLASSHFSFNRTVFGNNSSIHVSPPTITNGPFFYSFFFHNSHLACRVIIYIIWKNGFFVTVLFCFVFCSGRNSQYNNVCRLSNSKRLFRFLCKRNIIRWRDSNLSFPVPFSLSIFVCDIFKEKFHAQIQCLVV